MTSYKEALQKVLKTSKKNKVKKYTKDLNNEVLAENIKARRNNPFYNNSLLDGFAFKSSDTVKNSFFKINGELAVGEKKTIHYVKNTCYRISTGGKIIAPFDCMLPYEQVEVIDGLVQIPSKIKKYHNVRLEGSDFKKGKVLIKKNEKLSPAKKLLIKSSGNQIISTYETPNIVLFSSGDEITDQIKNNEKVINSIPEYFKSFSSKFYFNFTYLGIVKDNQKAIDNVFSKIKNLKNTIIISTGGVSAGHKDYFPKYLKQQKYKIQFHKIGMQPGRPTLFAIKDSKYYFGLPGNPISTIVGFHFLVMPLVLSMQNQKFDFKTSKLLHNYKKNPKLTELRRAFVNQKGVRIIPDQESYKLNSLVNANSWLLLDQKNKIIKKGDWVKFIDYEN